MEFDAHYERIMRLIPVDKLESSYNGVIQDEVSSVGHAVNNVVTAYAKLKEVRDAVRKLQNGSHKRSSSLSTAMDNILKPQLELASKLNQANWLVRANEDKRKRRRPQQASGLLASNESESDFGCSSKSESVSESSSGSEDEDNGLGTEESVPGRKKRSRYEVECTGISTGGLFTKCRTLMTEHEAGKSAMTRVLNLAAPQNSSMGLPRSADVSSNAKTGTASATTHRAFVNILKEGDEMQKVDKRDLDGAACAVGPASDEEEGRAETDDTAEAIQRGFNGLEDHTTEKTSSVSLASADGKQDNFESALISSKGFSPKPQHREGNCPSYYKSSFPRDFFHPSCRHLSSTTLRLTSFADVTQVPRGRKVSSDSLRSRRRDHEIGCPQPHFSWLMVDLSVLSVEKRSQRIVEEVVAFKTSILSDIDGRYLVEVTDAVEKVVRWIHRYSRDSKLSRLYGSLFKALSAYSTRLQCETQTAQLDRLLIEMSGALLKPLHPRSIQAKTSKEQDPTQEEELVQTKKDTTSTSDAPLTLATSDSDTSSEPDSESESDSEDEKEAIGGSQAAWNSIMAAIAKS